MGVCVQDRLGRIGKRHTTTRSSSRCASGKRAAGVSFVHKVMNKARMEGGSKDRALFARFFLSP
ncbi:hypothetical protein NBRC111894_1230 [Sporolactobacillus inulinus]|uniref:Uncharacterized protein n=1 Tax=Sporolactobacillus inulinus TaxID=2078 RepID=A0A4Y1Z9J3_9BACL|nr:hypothetical protein NBRC111894_1230 [Sporolactobacillus inulinus]